MMLLHVIFLLLLPLTTSQLPAPLLQLTKHDITNASQRGAVCNDNSPAVFYFRDCPRPGLECQINPHGDQWIIVFEGGEPSSVCFDQASCAARNPTFQSSIHFPSAFHHSMLDGIFSDSGEGNPNFYEHRIVWVPYCSSDMWLGDSTDGGTDSGMDSGMDSGTTPALTFKGHRIVQAVVEDLIATTFTLVSVPTPYGPGPNKTSIKNASQIVVVGNLGVIRWLDTIADQLIQASNKKNVNVSGICDGCLVSSLAPYVSLSTQPCTHDPASCPTSKLFSQYSSSAWNFQYPKGKRDKKDKRDKRNKRDKRGKKDYTSLFAMPLLADTKTPLQVHHPLYDLIQLKQNRLPTSAWPPLSGSQEEKYALSFAADIKTVMASHHQNTGMYTFAPACSGSPSSTLTNQSHGSSGPTSSSVLAHDSFFCLPIQNCTLLGRKSINAITQSAATSMFLNDPNHVFEPKCIDQCVGIDCNVNCKHPNCGL